MIIYIHSLSFIGSAPFAGGARRSRTWRDQCRRFTLTPPPLSLSLYIYVIYLCIHTHTHVYSRPRLALGDGAAT